MHTFLKIETPDCNEYERYKNDPTATVQKKKKKKDREGDEKGELTLIQILISIRYS